MPSLQYSPSKTVTITLIKSSLSKYSPVRLSVLVEVLLDSFILTPSAFQTNEYLMSSKSSSVTFIAFAVNVVLSRGSLVLNAKETASIFGLELIIIIVSSL